MRINKEVQEKFQAVSENYGVESEKLINRVLKNFLDCWRDKELVCPEDREETDFALSYMLK